MNLKSLTKNISILVASAALASNAFALNIGIVPTTGMGTAANVQSDLLGTGLFANVDLLSGLESQATLSGYDAILAYQNQTGDHAAIGDNLAQYVNNGGGLVAATFLWQNQGLSSYTWGALESGGYLPFGSYLGNYSSSSLGTYNALHPIMAGPLSVSAIDGYYRDLVTLSGDATLVASWADGNPFVAVDSSGVVGIALFPDDTYGTLSGDYMNLFGNALYYAANGQQPSVPDTGATLSFLALAMAGMAALRRQRA